MYQVRLAGPNQEGHSALVEVTANSARTVDLSVPSRDMARITLRFDGVGDSDSGPGQGRNGGVQVTLIDMDTQRGSFSSNGPEGGGGGLGARDQRDPSAERIIEGPQGAMRSY